MAAEKVVVMMLKVDLQCPCCYKKIKKTICKIPQIRDQIYDEKANIVTIKVVSCCPEIVRDKLVSKGGKTIKSIEIKEPAKPKVPEKEKPKPEGKPDKPKKDGGPPSDKPKPEGKGDKPKQDGPKPEGKGDKPKQGGGPPSDKPKPKQDGAPPSDKPKGPKPPQMVEPVPHLPAVAAAKGPEPVPVGVPSVFPYVGPTYDGYANGPYYHGYYGPVAPPAQPCYEGYYGYGYGYGRSGYPGRYDGNGYFSEENSQGCSIM